MRLVEMSLENQPKSSLGHTKLHLLGAKFCVAPLGLEITLVPDPPFSARGFRRSASRVG